MRIRYLLVALAVLAAAPAFAQKPQAVSPLELGEDPVVSATLPSADGTAAYARGRAVALYNQNALVRPGTPEAMAREFLQMQEAAFGVREADMEVVAVREGDAGTTVRFRQTVDGVPVWGSESAVSMDPLGRVQIAFNQTREVPTLDTTPAVAPEAARAAAHAHLGISGTVHHDETELVVWPQASGARLAWRVSVVATVPGGDWETIVDAQTGELLRVANREVTHKGETPEPPVAIPTVQSHPLYARTDATGLIFDPDPLTRAGVARGTFGYSDANDLDSPELNAARVAVTLRDVSEIAGQFVLRGPWAHIEDWDLPTEGIYGQPEPEWSFPRSNDAFEAATAYWHLDNYMRYVNETLGVFARPQAYSGGVRFDAKGWFRNGRLQDNSSFTPSTDRLTFGHGGVDDAEDADVIIHELGHGLDDWITGSTQQPDGLSEGFGDYIAASYTRGLGLLDPSDESYQWVFKWDGHNQFWAGRRTDITTRYPQGDLPHPRGQHWSTSLMRVWDVLGQQKTDKAVFEGMAMTSGATTQPEAAQAVLQAAANLGYTADEVQVFYTSFLQQGYSGLTFPAVSNEASGDGLPTVAELTSPRPNPFFGTTEVELRVQDAQHVTVTVVDALGREVARLLDEAVVAGRRYPLTLDGRGLESGIYVVRARGRDFQRTQRVTLVR